MVSCVSSKILSTCCESNGTRPVFDQLEAMFLSMKAFLKADQNIEKKSRLLSLVWPSDCQMRSSRPWL